MSTTQVRDGEVPTFGVSGGSHRCLIWGDSHAMALIPAIDAACKARDIQGFQATHSSTAPILDSIVAAKYGLNERSPEFNRAVMHFAIAHKVDVVFIACLWSDYANKPGIYV